MLYGTSLNYTAKLALKNGGDQSFLINVPDEEVTTATIIVVFFIGL